ncbi:diguanylate cyclase [uncultured Pseudodesulfovibrio sp.]|uniref:sensor domain-containing diguanylate cyclase n=1 Tax=uncultured Pseudodesulfovibrio sp. TaxID=2035858 RepID=UPI0029C77F29|nr:diguanylate cyclase [uncultured Pseudodesulfovibrio sp.]
MKNKALILVSTFIVLSDLLFILINYYSALNAINVDTRRWADEAEHVFALAMDAKSTSMQQLASFVANMPQVQKLFQQAKSVYDVPPVERDETRLSSIRSQLFDYVEPSWNRLTSSHDVRQLHFHFGPGSTSFLRVHRPDKYGDNMDQVRYTVADVNRMHAPVKGFETGRVYSGIRGVVPVKIRDSKERAVHLGALEAGTSFTGMLKVLSTELDSNIVVLLHKSHVQRNMWPDFVRNHFKKNSIVGNYYIEGSTSPSAWNFLSQQEVADLVESGEDSAFMNSDKPVQVAVFPLRDYRGMRDWSLPSVGEIVIWRDATEKWEVLRSSLMNNIFYSFFALIVIEIILILGWRFSQRHLKMVIKRQTRKLRKLARQDGLTGLYNRRTIEEFLKGETSRASRHGSVFSVIMFDIDFFKNINDTYGHNAGDEVLKGVSSCAARLVRVTDRVGRWGGEEFLVVVPETSLEEAVVLAERIRNEVAAQQYRNAASVTVSLGVAQYQSDDSYDLLVQRADGALYEAKEGGRNRVVTAG